jgi:hypothetical protein
MQKRNKVVATLAQAVATPDGASILIGGFVPARRNLVNAPRSGAKA